MTRERLRSRLGFLMLAAGSAVGLGNVWRFPYMAGRNGGAAFVLVYLAFLALLGFPLLAAELGIGRGAGRSIAAALPALAPPRTRNFWRRAGIVLASGCFVLMIYYTDITGWLLKYATDFACGTVPADPKAHFDAFVSDWKSTVTPMLATVALASLTCLAGVANGVERVTKWMMLGLLAILGVLAAKSMTLPGAAEGLSFYLKPDWGKFMEHPLSSAFDALGQAFFTLSIGIGSMTICGSYIGKDNSLVKESAIIIAIDTLVAIASGLVVFPACATYGVPYGQGAGLIFAALPEVFAQMPCGAAWGALFFAFLSCAALTTVIAVFECIIAGLMDVTGMERRTAVAAAGLSIAALSMPAVLSADAIEWEDFAVSKIWLPLGALMQGVFVVSPAVGWGWKSFRSSVSEGSGPKMPNGALYVYCAAIGLLVLALAGGFFAI